MFNKVSTLQRGQLRWDCRIQSRLLFTVSLIVIADCFLDSGSGPGDCLPRAPHSWQRYVPAVSSILTNHHRLRCCAGARPATAPTNGHGRKQCLHSVFCSLQLQLRLVNNFRPVLNFQARFQLPNVVGRKKNEELPIPL